MAAIRKAKLTVSSTAQSVGDAEPSDFVFVNTGANPATIDCNGGTANDTGFVLTAGARVSNKDLPDFFKRGPYSLWSSAGTTVYVQFSKERGS